MNYQNKIKKMFLFVKYLLIKYCLKTETILLRNVIV